MAHFLEDEDDRLERLEELEDLDAEGYSVADYVQPTGTAIPRHSDEP